MYACVHNIAPPSARKAGTQPVIPYCRDQRHNERIHNTTPFSHSATNRKLLQSMRSGGLNDGIFRAHACVCGWQTHFTFIRTYLHARVYARGGDAVAQFAQPAGVLLVSCLTNAQISTSTAAIPKHILSYI